MPSFFRNNRNGNNGGEQPQHLPLSFFWDSPELPPVRWDGSLGEELVFNANMLAKEGGQRVVYVHGITHIQPATIEVTHLAVADESVSRQGYAGRAATEFAQHCHAALGVTQVIFAPRRYPDFPERYARVFEDIDADRDQTNPGRWTLTF